MSDPYTDPATGVLRNSLGITDPDVLAAAEADITAARIARLAERPIPGSYDLAHLLAFHREIFGSIYPWAGQVRTVDIAKESTRFCLARNIPDFAQDVFGRLARRENLLRDLPREEFLTKLADLYGDINALHPLREGNGRAQRAYLAQLSAEAGHRLEWTGMDPERNRLASIASFNGHSGPLRALLADLTAAAASTAPTARGPVIQPSPQPRPAGPRPRP
jgi:cell filamentation protein